jgi:hypothetical protein
MGQAYVFLAAWAKKQKRKDGNWPELRTRIPFTLAHQRREGLSSTSFHGLSYEFESLIAQRQP